MNRIALLLLLAAAAAPLQAAHRIKGHFREDGTWVRARWSSRSSYDPYRGGVGDPFYKLDLEDIFRRPYKRAEAPPPPVGLAVTWRDELQPDLPPKRQDFAFADRPEWRRALDRVRWERGVEPAPLPLAPRVMDGVVWTETDTHRVKTKYRDGQVVGEWRFPRKGR